MIFLRVYTILNNFIINTLTTDNISFDEYLLLKNKPHNSNITINTISDFNTYDTLTEYKLQDSILYNQTNNIVNNFTSNSIINTQDSILYDEKITSFNSYENIF